MSWPFAAEDVTRLRALPDEWALDLADRIETGLPPSDDVVTENAARTDPGWLGFHAWYERMGRLTGRTVYDWFRFPTDRLVRVTVYYPDRRVFLTGGEWYVLERPAPRAEGVDGVFWRALPGELRKPPKGCVSCVKRGGAAHGGLATAIDREAEATTWP